MKEQYNYIVLGAGRQGTAAAYDMALWGDANWVVLADINLETARKAADRVNSLSARQKAEPVQVNISDLHDLARKLEGMHACLSAVPYVYNLDIAKVALEMGVNCCDLGGNTAIARQQHKFDAEARKIPDLLSSIC